ncbi:MAG: hypothetical protein ACT4QD_22565 [Acidobacteriota bacterium]
MHRATYAASYGDIVRSSDLWDAGILRALNGADTDRLLSWIPAIEFAWLGGMTEEKQGRLLRFIQTRHGTTPHQVQRLLRGWLTREPNGALFEAARRTLLAQLEILPTLEREAFTARIIGPCIAIASTSGVGTSDAAGLSSLERGWLLTLMHDLQIDHAC